MLRLASSRPWPFAGAAAVVAVNVYLLGATSGWGGSIKEDRDCRYISGNLCPASTSCRNLMDASFCTGEGVPNYYVSWDEQTFPIWQCFKIADKCCVSAVDPPETICARRHFYAEHNCVDEILACYLNTSEEECALTIQNGDPECDI